MDIRDKYFLMRKRKKITLKQVADSIGISAGMISHHERSERNLSSEYEIKYRKFIDNH